MKKIMGKEKRSFSKFFYHLLLYLYPRSFRLEYGDLMQQAYHRLYQEAKKNGGYLGVLLLWQRLLWDFASSIGWEYLDEYERSSGMKKIAVQELLRSLAIGWGTMILLTIFNKGSGWSSETVLLIACAAGLISFVGFSIYRVKSGKELMIQTQKGWIIFGTIVIFAILAYAVIAYNKGASLLENLFPILLAFLVVVSGIWWGIRKVKKD